MAIEVEDLEIKQLVKLRSDVADVLQGKNVGDVLTVLADHVAAAIASGVDSSEMFAEAVQVFTSSVIFRGFDIMEMRINRRKAH